MKDGHQDGHQDDGHHWRKLTDQDIPLEKAAQAVLAVKLPYEDAAACLAPGASAEEIEKLRTLGGFSDHVHTLLDSLHASTIFTEDAERAQISTDLTKAVKHIVMVKDGLERFARADIIPLAEERAMRNDVSHGNEHGLYDKISEYLATVARWVEFRTDDIERADPKDFETQMKKEHVRDPLESKVIPVHIRGYNETLFAYRDLHPERIRAASRALAFFQQEYDRILGSAMQPAAGRT